MSNRPLVDPVEATFRDLGDLSLALEGDALAARGRIDLRTGGVQQMDGPDLHGLR